MQIERFHYVLHASSHPHACNRNWKNRIEEPSLKRFQKIYFSAKGEKTATQNSLLELEFIIV